MGDATTDASCREDKKMINLKLSYSKIASSLFIIMMATDFAFGESVKLYKIPKYLMLMFFTVMVLRLVFSKRTIAKTTVLFAPILFTFIEYVSYFWALYPSVAFEQFKTQFQLLILFLLVFYFFRSEDHLDDYLKAIYYAGFIMAGYAIFAYGLSGIVLRMLSGVRVGSLIGNENSFGMVFSRATLVAFGYYLSKRRPWYLIVMAVMIFFAFSSGSRKAILIILVGVLGIVVFYFGFKRVWKLFLCLCLIAVAVYFVMSLPFMSSAAQRLVDSLNGKQDASAFERNSLIRIGWEAIKERPFLGYGIANFGTYFPKTGYSHNNFIEILFSVGMVGFAVYYTMHVQAGVRIAKLVMHGADWRYVVLFILLGINILFAWWMVQFYTRESWVFLAVILATTERALHKRGE